MLAPLAVPNQSHSSMKNSSQQGSPQPLALVVDHALRSESREEALVAVAQCQRLGLDTALLELHWPVGKPCHGAMLQARHCCHSSFRFSKEYRQSSL